MSDRHYFGILKLAFEYTCYGGLYLRQRSGLLHSPDLQIVACKYKNKFP